MAEPSEEEFQRGTMPQALTGRSLYDFDDLHRAVVSLEGLRKAVGAVNPRPPGWHNDLIQLGKKLLARVLGWYTRPLEEFHASVSRSLEHIVSADENLSMELAALDERLAQAERSAAKVESMQEKLEFLDEQVKALVGVRESLNPEATPRRLETALDTRAPEDSRVAVETRPEGDRTAYVVGLFGTGRMYINELILANIGERAKYFRDFIGLHPGPTSMIYSGHATMKHVSRAQALPSVMKCVLEAVRSRFADLIFIYRHPLDSLLTNWVWWRTYIRENRRISGISEVYKNTDDLCVDLEENFFEFKAFAEGDPDFFAAVPGLRFLSFAEFVEETELHLESATLTLRLEDFTVDPLKEFIKIAEVMSVDLDTRRLRITPPRSKPYGHLGVKAKVPRFRRFIERLEPETKRRLARIDCDVKV